MKNLSKAGMKKLNFAGGEPMLYQKFVGELAKYCKTELNLESVSIVSNGSKMSLKFLEKYGEFIDIIAISCDSFRKETNQLIGRQENGEKDHISKLFEIHQWLKIFKIKFKLNTVVNKFNWNEDMNAKIAELSPFRWKCFQVLVVETENNGDGTKRDARDFQITSEKFTEFLERHKGQHSLVPESNELMRNSYLILDENLCFLNSELGKGRLPSGCLLDISVDEALKQSGWDESAFASRGGVYEWTKTDGCSGKEIEW
jgi:radical S-adenosyl methionine domain-containing protein 2